MSKLFTDSLRNIRIIPRKHINCFSPLTNKTLSYHFYSQSPNIQSKNPKFEMESYSLGLIARLNNMDRNDYVLHSKETINKLEYSYYDLVKSELSTFYSDGKFNLPDKKDHSLFYDTNDISNGSKVKIYIKTNPEVGTSLFMVKGDMMLARLYVRHSNFNGVHISELNINNNNNMFDKLELAAIAIQSLGNHFKSEEFKKLDEKYKKESKSNYDVVYKRKLRLSCGITTENSSLIKNIYGNDNGLYLKDFDDLSNKATVKLEDINKKNLLTKQKARPIDAISLYYGNYNNLVKG